MQNNVCELLNYGIVLLDQLYTVGRDGQSLGPLCLYIGKFKFTLSLSDSLQIAKVNGLAKSSIFHLFVIIVLILVFEPQYLQNCKSYRCTKVGSDDPMCSDLSK